MPFFGISQDKKADLLLAESTIGDGIGFQYQSKLDSRLAAIFKYGRPSFPSYDAFVVMPSLEKTKETPIDTMPGGVVFTYRLRLSVKNAITNQTLGARDIEITGMGRQKDEATVRALSSIRLTNRDLRGAVEKIRQEVRDFYLTKPDSVMASVQKLLANKQFGEAFVLASSVPEDAPKFGEFSKMKETAFIGYQENICALLTTRIETALASENPGRAAEILATFSPSSPCAADMKPKLAGIQARLPEADRNNYSWIFNGFSDENGAKSSRSMTEAAMTAEILTGDWAKMRFVKTKI